MTEAEDFSRAGRSAYTRHMAETINLLERDVYGLGQVDRLLGLKGGTARRWIEGYTRGQKTYPPVVREQPTGQELVSWGEFVETRLLAEFRDAGVSIVRLRPAVERLRKQLDTRYPLATARPFLDVEGRELVWKVQEAVGLEHELQIVVVRSGQIVLTEPAQRFADSATFRPSDGVVELLRPVADIGEVVIDPLRQFGEPVVRNSSVRTEIITEQIRAGESIDAIAEMYDLRRPEVEAALRYELVRGDVAA
jgi:uncharacterized protein (DUF433 family)